MLPHTHTMPLIHTHGTLTRAQRLQFRVARLDLALLWCFAAYFMACWAHCVFASCPLPVTDLFAFPFVCLPPPLPRLALFHSPLCTYHTQPCFNLHKNSHVDCRLVHFDVIVRLISSLSSVWQSNCLTASLFLFLSSLLCSAAYFCISITWFTAFAAQTADNCAPDGMRIWLTCEPVRV